MANSLGLVGKTKSSLAQTFGFPQVGEEVSQEWRDLATLQTAQYFLLMQSTVWHFASVSLHIMLPYEHPKGC